MTDDIDALIAQLRGISLYSFQGDLDPDERRRELTNIYEAVQVGLLLASRVRAALVEARERVAEWERDYRAVITEDCDSRETAEQHCTCVPHLRRRIAELEQERDAARADAARLREEARWVPVIDKLPPEGVDVEFMQIHRGTRHGKRWLDNEAECAYRGITHWRNLPEEPDGN